jgi:sugar O-acyltransferase (sialic acid O-acetyltransferase NeuD family)
MYLYGASGHAKVIIDILTNLEIDIQGVFDDDINKQKIFSYMVQAVPEGLETLDGHFIISIGDNKIRKSLSEKYSLVFGLAIHSSCIMAESVSIGNGTVIMASTVINSSVVIGKHVIINTSASIDHDCVIEDYVHISPSACLCGDVKIGTGSHIGAGAVILPGVTIGCWSTIGAGSVVLRDIPDLSVAVGNPARIIRELNK